MTDMSTRFFRSSLSAAGASDACGLVGFAGQTRHVAVEGGYGRIFSGDAGFFCRIWCRNPEPMSSLYITTT